MKILGASRQQNDKEDASWLAQKPVRQLTLTGVGAVALTLLVTTSISLWYGRLRAEAGRVGNALHVAQLAAGQGTIAINEAWSNGLQFEAAAQPDPGARLDGWVRELELASSLCDQLNEERLVVEYCGHLQISIAPLEKLSDDAKRWQQAARSLQSQIFQQRQKFDEIAEQMMRRAEGIRGTERLNLAVALRNQGKGVGELNIKKVMSGSVTTASIYQLMNDLTDLQLNLHLLLSSKNSDQIVDLENNKIRTQLLRIATVYNDDEIDELASSLHDVVLAPLQSSGNAFQGGLCHLQLRLAELELERSKLLGRTSDTLRTLGGERARLIEVGRKLQESNDARLARALGFAWTIIFLCGVLTAGTFLWLGRRVSSNIAAQVEAINASKSALANEQLLLSSVITSVPIPFFWKDLEGRYQGCSQSYADWLGLSNPQEIVGKTDAELPWDPRTMASKVETEDLISTHGKGFSSREVVKGRADGTEAVVLASKMPLMKLDGRQRGIVGAYIDITERKKKDERIRHLARITAECPIEIFVFELGSFALLEVNKAAGKNLGFAQEELLGRPFTQLNSSKEQLTKVLAPLVSGTKSQISFESTLRRLDGTTYPVHLSVIMIEEQSQNVFVACATDLTEHKDLERKLSQSQKLESIGQLAAGIAHEINTPMQCISGNIQFLQTWNTKMLQVVDVLQEQLTEPARNWKERAEELKDLMKENHFEYVKKQMPLAIDESAQATDKVVEIVRAMKVMSHPGSTDKAQTELNSLIRDAVTVSRNRWKGIAEVELELDEALPHVEAFPAPLSQVFLNLIVNAADAIGEKYGIDSGVLGQITIRTRFDDESVYLEFGDDGIGMSEQVQNRIFEPFFTTKDVGKGTGQGLSITYDVVVKMHGGGIEIKSVLGQGTTFCLSMPRSAVDQALDGETREKDTQLIS